MKIMYVIHGLCIGGAETLITNYLIELKRKGYEVYLVELVHVNSYLYKRLVDENVTVIYLCASKQQDISIKAVISKLISKISRINRINEIVNKVHPDIIHFHTPINQIDKLQINYSCLFFTFHTSVIRTFSIFGKKFERALINSCKKDMKIIALDERMKTELEHKIPNSKILVVHNGINLTEIRKNSLTKHELCEIYNIPDDAYVLGHVGRFHPVKNHEKVIDVFNEICMMRPKSYLILVGTGSLKSICKIRQRVEELGLTEKVVFAGQVDDAYRLVAGFDCLILPSHVEGFPLVVEEAQACGIRCVLTDTVSDEIVCNGNCYRMSSEESSIVWADTILNAKENNQCRDISELDINYTVECLIKEYSKVIDV